MSGVRARVEEKVAEGPDGWLTDGTAVLQQPVCGRVCLHSCGKVELTTGGRSSA